MKMLGFFSMLFFVGFCLLSFAQNSFSEGEKFNIKFSQQASKLGENIDQNLEKFEQSVSKGLDKAGRAIDLFVKDLNRLIKDMDAKASVAQGKLSDSYQESRTAVIKTLPDRIARSTGYKKGDVSDAFKDFLESLGGLFKALGKWIKAFWDQITGPTEEENPLASTWNEMKTKYYRWSLGHAWKNFTSSSKDLGNAISRFVKNLFK